MKNKLVLTVVLAIMVVVFLGCEAEPSLPELTIGERIAVVKDYHHEIFSLMASSLEDSASADFAEGDPITFDEGLSGIVIYSDVDEINMYITLNIWVAEDGTEISGTIVLDVEYLLPRYR